MSRDRVKMHRLQEFVRLHRMGSKSREVARLLRMSPNTERQYRLALTPTGILSGDPQDLPEIESLKVLIEKELPRKLPPQQTTSLKAYEEEIEKLFSKGVGAQAIYDHLRLERAEFGGSLSAVKRLWRRLKRARGVRAEEVAIPVETQAGEVAQVDFGYVGRLNDPEEGALKKAWVFVLVLGYSRHLFAKVVFDQKVETWLRVHVEAFGRLGGVPAVVVRIPTISDRDSGGKPDTRPARWERDSGGKPDTDSDDFGQRDRCWVGWTESVGRVSGMLRKCRPLV